MKTLVEVRSMLDLAKFSFASLRRDNQADMNVLICWWDKKVPPSIEQLAFETEVTKFGVVDTDKVSSKGIIRVVTISIRGFKSYIDVVSYFSTLSAAMYSEVDCVYVAMPRGSAETVVSHYGKHIYAFQQ